MPDASSVPPAFLAPDRLLSASIDGHLYCTHEALGNVQWRVSTGESVNQPPVGVNGAALLFTDNGGLFCIDGESGREKWWISGVKGFLSATKEKLYCYDPQGNIVVLDAQTGARTGSIPVQNLEFRYLNTLTDRIILGTPGGTLMMLRESSRTWPVVHGNQELEKAQRPQVEVKQMPGGGAGVGEPPMPMPADPFGGAADPFGDPKPMPMNKPPAGADPIDPFK
jgi:hypothetical protein